MLKTEDIVYACTCDFAGKTRGKGFPARDLDKRLKRGVGWAPTNTQITCFDVIAPTPFGALGERVLIPDPATRVTLRAPEIGLCEDFVLGDLHTTDGEPWELCPRLTLKAALERLKRVAGLTLLATFEHEFQFRDAHMGKGTAFSLQAFRTNRPFAERLIGAMRAAGLEPDTIMKEFGADQFEVTMGPAQGVTAADHSVILRQLVYAVAESCGHAATFTPLQDPAGVGNGVHIHFSFLDKDGNPATFDPKGKHRMTKAASAFAGGVLRHVDEIMAILAPSVVSYGRLTPNRWSAAFNNLGVQDREATLRICPVSAMSDVETARQFNLEFRAADACASPYLQLAALVHAGCQGIEDGLTAPDATEENLANLTPDELEARGFRRLPTNLSDALDKFATSDHIRDWFGEDFVEVYRLHKQGEMDFLAGSSEEDLHRAYALVY